MPNAIGTVSWKPLPTVPKSDRAPEPKTPMDRKIRKLAEAAMSACHHDCDPEFDIEWHHEVKTMEEKFRRILRSKGE